MMGSEWLHKVDKVTATSAISAEFIYLFILKGCTVPILVSILAILGWL